MLIVGLTGGSGAGKSTVSAFFREHGFCVADADRIYASLIDAPSPCTEAIASAFGCVLLPSGAVDRAALRALVFSDPEKLTLLNKTVHPLVLDEIVKLLRVWREGGEKVCVVDAPQLFESGADRLCSVTLAVLADRDVRIARIMARDGITKEDAARRLAVQIPDDWFRSHCDYVIENSGDVEMLKNAFESFLVRFGLSEER